MPKESIVHFCDWLPPDFGAVGQYSLLFARDYAMAGHDIVLIGITSNLAPSVEVERYGDATLTIRRVSMPVYDRSDRLRRVAWTAQANLRLMRAAWQDLRRAETILFTGSPPFLLHFVVPANLVLRKRLLYRITDFHPECLMATLEKVPWHLRLFHRYTVALRRKVDTFQVLGEDQRQRLHTIGIDDERIVLKRDPAPIPIDAQARPLARPAEIRDSVILLYSGNYGVAHEVETVLAGYEIHHRQGSGRVVLWLNATGAKADELERALRKRSLPVHRSRLVPIEQVGRLLVTPEAHLITLRDAFIGYVMPSKTYGCIESNRDIIFVGNPRSDVHLLCRTRKTSGQNYQQIDVGDAVGFMSALEALADRQAIAPRQQTG
jgi:hypothetical protein